jgi:hypothetical protein
MSLTLRNTKGSPLTYNEMDNNLTYLEGVATATGGTGVFDNLIVSGTSDLGEVILTGDISFSNGKGLKNNNASVKLGTFGTLAAAPNEPSIRLGEITLGLDSVSGMMITTDSVFTNYITLNNMIGRGFEMGAGEGETNNGFYTNTAYLELGDYSGGFDYISIFATTTSLNNLNFYDDGPGDVISSKNPTNATTKINGLSSGDKADRFFLYSKDIIAGNAAPHFRTENGSEIKLYRQINAALANTPNTGDANTDALITALKDIIINAGFGSAS